VVMAVVMATTVDTMDMVLTVMAHLTATVLLMATALLTVPRLPRLPRRMLRLPSK
jgi:uncharacterized membrane protein